MNNKGTTTTSSIISMKDSCSCSTDDKLVDSRKRKIDVVAFDTTSSKPTMPEASSKPQDYKSTRAERKRQLEKKRRTEVNKGFDELTSLILEVDPRVRMEAQERSMGEGSGGGREVFNRIELISRAVSVLKRVHNENQQRKKIIEALSNPLGGADGSGQLRAATSPVPQTTIISAAPSPAESLLDRYLRAEEKEKLLGQLQQQNGLRQTVLQQATSLQPTTGVTSLSQAILARQQTMLPKVDTFSKASLLSALPWGDQQRFATGLRNSELSRAPASRSPSQLSLLQKAQDEISRQRQHLDAILKDATKSAMI